MLRCWHGSRRKKITAMDEILFQGAKYVLNQCEDIWQWFEQSKVGEYTRYYSQTVFHTANGIIAAPSDDLKNWYRI